MYILYDLLFLFVLIFYFLPFYLIKRKYPKKFLQRLGIFPKKILQKLGCASNIWIHGVSVGEAMIACQLAKKIEAEIDLNTNTGMVISTTTSTGYKVARNLAGSNEVVIYFPLDLSFIIRRVIKLIKPYIIILVETELWPNIIIQAYKKNIPVTIVNGRISDKSYLGYKYISKVLKGIFKYIKLFCMQSVLDGRRIISLGASKEKVKVCGNMKFDEVSIRLPEDKVEKLKNWIDYKGNNDIIFVCGSTHCGEEEILIDVHKNLLSEGYSLKLVIVPRHVERREKLKCLVESNDFYPLFFSSFSNKLSLPNRQVIYIMDRIGWLKSLYFICDLAFVGGSLKKYGGHNIIEPAIFSKPIIFGPYISNFKTVAAQFLDYKAAIQVKNKTQIYETCCMLLNKDSFRLELGKRALEVVKRNQGATQKIVNLIKPFLPC